ncbi:MAG: hypothetical protein AB7Q00_01390 [Phycisphaerales bacterium]|nr:MAG: hypothetical protein IPK69_06000 [Phycisphaerales bacterium]
MDPTTLDIASTLTQFGTAGLIGWMWLTERKGALARDRQIAEAHEALMHERAAFAVVIEALRENTKALAAIDSSQRELARTFSQAIERLSVRTVVDTTSSPPRVSVA